MTKRIAGAGLLARGVVALPLLVAGFLKAVGPAEEFAATIEAYHILPTGAIPLLAQSLSWVELWIGTFILFGWQMRRTACAAAVLYLSYTGVHVWAIYQHIDLSSCGCFGALATLSPLHMVVLNAIAFLIAIGIAQIKQPNFTVDNWIARGL